VGAAVVALAAAGLAGCGSEAAGTGGRPLVVATTTQLADFARVVGGRDVEVYGLLRPNVDAHDFEPSPADLDALARADVVLANGLGLEPWLDDAVDASGGDAPVVDTSEGAHPVVERGSPNPHLWFDPRNARVMVDHVAAAIRRAVPKTAATRAQARATKYRDDLARLDRWIRDQVATLQDRQLVTDHDAFASYVARYDLELVGSIIPSFDSAAEVSAGDLDDLARSIEARHVRAIFTERSLPPKAADALARRTGVEVVSGDDGLYGDSLGPRGSDGATYLTMMRHNTRSIVEHLR
jgi:ABC-type Zn uptake system ZnuABC Zn-binding protein ZnuA